MKHHWISRIWSVGWITPLDLVLVEGLSMRPLQDPAVQKAMPGMMLAS